MATIATVAGSIAAGNMLAQIAPYLAGEGHEYLPLVDGLVASRHPELMKTPGAMSLGLSGLEDAQGASLIGAVKSWMSLSPSVLVTGSSPTEGQLLENTARHVFEDMGGELLAALDDTGAWPLRIKGWFPDLLITTTPESVARWQEYVASSGRNIEEYPAVAAGFIALREPPPLDSETTSILQAARREYQRLIFFTTYGEKPFVEQVRLLKECIAISEGGDRFAVVFSIHPKKRDTIIGNERRRFLQDCFGSARLVEITGDSGAVVRSGLINCVVAGGGSPLLVAKAGGVPLIALGTPLTRAFRLEDIGMADLPADIRDTTEIVPIIFDQCPPTPDTSIRPFDGTEATEAILAAMLRLNIA